MSLAARSAMTFVVAICRSIERRRRRSTPRRTEEADAESPSIMRCMPPDQIRVLGQLARDYALCKRWYSSVPGATWPNRNFLHAGTSAEAVDIEVGLYDDVTVFEMLEDERNQQQGSRDRPVPWRIYFSGMPQVMVFKHLLTDERADQWRAMNDFWADVQRGTLPSYAFIEPRHKGKGANSYHPGNNQKVTSSSSDFARGEELVRRIYVALRNNEPLFRRTAIVITFDEHGGFFDRVSPPSTVHPVRGNTLRHPQTATRRFVAWFAEQRNAPFDFKRLGMRVPTIIISAYTPPAVVPHTFDHTSVIATLRDLFAPNQRPLTRRDRRARPFWDLFVGPERQTITDIPPPNYPPEAEAVQAPAETVDRMSRGDRHLLPSYLTDGELPEQLENAAKRLTKFLDDQGVPAPPPRAGYYEEGDFATEYTGTDVVAARVAAWKPGAARRTPNTT